MTGFDAASAAVQAALDAGARYADARVMHRRYESMSARNGEIEELTQDESLGLGVRALVGSSWGFHAVPELSGPAARDAGRRAARIATASARVPGPPIDLVPSAPATASWSSPCEVDPLGVALSDKGDLLVGATATMAAHGADVAEGLYQIWDTAKWFVSSEGHRIDQRTAWNFTGGASG
ncbi:TldD protein [Micromonospora olivasterospora]|uniref:TldD protein n=1 Tax=Micromonospora olivasterospora TaxID=1880 RepID=A0A562I716_MICOL|nr:TldD protein [Micromonospora olivasterospora]